MQSTGSKRTIIQFNPEDQCYHPQLSFKVSQKTAGDWGLGFMEQRRNTTRNVFQFLWHFNAVYVSETGWKCPLEWERHRKARCNFDNSNLPQAIPWPPKKMYIFLDSLQQFNWIVKMLNQKKKIERNGKCFAVMQEIEQTVSHCLTLLIRHVVCWNFALLS